MSSIQKQMKGLDWGKVEKYDFSFKSSIKEIIVENKSLKELGCKEPFAWPDGTPISAEAVRKHITKGMAELAIAMLKDEGKS